MRPLPLPLLPFACVTLAACAAAPQAASTFTLARGQSADIAPGLSLSFDAVDDSRCPPGVRCVWAGRLSYRFSLRRAGQPPETVTLSPGQPAAAPALLDGRRIVLDEAAIPAAPAPGAAIDYRATIAILPSNLPTTP
jgi:hypothetical protein